MREIYKINKYFAKIHKKIWINKKKNLLILATVFNVYNIFPSPKYKQHWLRFNNKQNKYNGKWIQNF